MKRRPLTDCPDELPQRERQKIRAWVNHQIPKSPAWGYVGRRLQHHYDEMRDWHLANGVRRADWSATMRNWLRKAVQYAERDREHGELERESQRYKRHLEEMAAKTDLTRTTAGLMAIDGGRK